MKLKLELELKRIIDSPPADISYVLEELRNALEGSDLWVQDDDNEDESGFTIVTVRLLN